MHFFFAIITPTNKKHNTFLYSPLIAEKNKAPIKIFRASHFKILSQKIGTKKIFPTLPPPLHFLLKNRIEVPPHRASHLSSQLTK